MKKVISLILVIMMACAVSLPAYAAEKAVGTTVKLSETSGTVKVSDQSGKSLSARVGMKLTNGYSVGTGTGSYAFITLDSTKAVKLDASSSAQVKASGSRLEVMAKKGKLYFSVDAPLSSTQRLNISTSTMTTGIRGSYGWVAREEIGLLHGHVTVTCKAYRSSETVVFELTGGEGVRYDPEKAENGAQAFEKFIIKEENVPYFVIPEIRKNVNLQNMIKADVSTLDVERLLALETVKGEEETAMEQSRQNEMNVKLQRLSENRAKITSVQEFGTISSGSRGKTDKTSGG